MNQSQQMISSISALSGDLAEGDSPGLAIGDKVRFGGGAIHGRYVGEITRLFRNGKASVKSTVRGQAKVFHPDMDDMTLFTEGLDEGETKTAVFSKQAKTLQYFDSRNTQVTVNAANVAQARKIIKRSGVDQELEIR